ncbi:MAG TPA: hypothetical protein ENK50_01415 [Sedimenticola sp.]|nr:hypothetical protein [Sedimenticola sp.]
MIGQAERRVAEASALRTLFHDHWIHLKRLLRRHELERQRWKREQQRLDSAVEVIVDGTDGRLRGVSRYQRRLRNSARGLLNYINQLVAELPHALDLSRQGFQSGPMAGSLLRGPAQAGELFVRNREVVDFFSDPAYRDRHEVFALLFLSRRERRTLGPELHGDLIVGDVLHRCVEFGGHRLVAPTVSETRARQALKRILFETSVEYLQGYMARLRHGLLEAGERRDLPGQGEGIDNPETYLQVLEWLLSLPLDLVRIQSDLVRIDNMGILLPDGEDAATARELDLREIAVGRRPLGIVTVVRYPRSEYQAALARHGCQGGVAAVRSA